MLALLRKNSILISVFILALLVRIFLALQPLAVLWDASIYIGMGKYFFSHGTIGVFEVFRPPLISIVLGALWKIGIDPFNAGKILAIFCSLLEMLVVYFIGKRISKNIGFIAAILISFSTVFVTYSTTPLSDIPSTLFTTIALLCTLREEYWFAGIAVGLAFLTRFPQALILVPIFISIILSQKTTRAVYSKQILKVFFGFFITTLPYLLVNTVLYKNPFLPIILANRVASDPINAHGYKIFFYTLNLLKENPFLIFSLIALMPLFYYGKKYFSSENSVLMISEKEKVLLINFLALLFMGSYFNFNKHIELRYSISFLPFVAILAGYGISALISQISETRNVLRKYLELYIPIIITLILTGILIFAYSILAPQYATTPQIDNFLHYFENHPNVSVLTSSPQMVSFSDIKVAQALDTWENAKDAYINSGEYADYFALNDCAIVCNSPTTCEDARHFVTENLQKTEPVVFNETSLGCHLTIYKHTK